MSRIGDALKRAGAPDIAEGIQDLPLTDLFVQAVPQPPTARTAGIDGGVEHEASGDDPQVRAVPPPFDDLPPRIDSRLVLNPDLPALAVEQYRRLAATLHHVQEDRGIKRVLISSAVANEGKTLTSTNLALTLSHSYQKRVLLVDADLRRPRVNVLLNIPNGEGLSEVLDRRDVRKLPVVKVSPLLSVLPAGRATPDPMAGLTSSRMAALLDEAAAHFDWVIVDTPPVGLLTDARLLAAMTDAALLVIGANATPCAAVQRAIEAIGRERVLGVVLNRADEALAAGGDYHYYYGYYGHPDHNGRGRGFVSRLLSRR